jgi:hypothetical protein
VAGLGLLFATVNCPARETILQVLGTPTQPIPAFNFHWHHACYDWRVEFTFKKVNPDSRASSNHKRCKNERKRMNILLADANSMSGKIGQITGGVMILIVVLYFIFKKKK